MKQITFQNVYNTSGSAQFGIGEQAQTPDGRKWTYVKATTGTLAKGSVAVPIAPTTANGCSSSTNNQGLIVFVTKAAAGWTAGQFAGSTMTVVTGTGVGQQAKIVSNTADTLFLAPENALATALAVADSNISIYSNNQVTKAAITSKLQNAVGVAQTAFANLDFGWVLFNGVGSVLAGEVLVVGGAFCTGAATTGEVLKNIATESGITAQVLGRCLVANNAADQNTLAFIEI